ncbi:hypothetical protein ACFYSB_37490, partial [Streptomyces prasinus]
MSLAPRAVLVHRTTEYEELVARHSTHGQAAFFLSSRGRDLGEVAERHRRAHRALAEVAAAIPLAWRQARVERSDLDRFLFAPEDIVVVVGQDGLGDVSLVGLRTPLLAVLGVLGIGLCQHFERI